MVKEALYVVPPPVAGAVEEAATRVDVVEAGLAVVVAGVDASVRRPCQYDIL
jgi:hypothetical protein